MPGCAQVAFLQEIEASGALPVPTFSGALDFSSAVEESFRGARDPVQKSVKAWEALSY